MKHMLEWLSGKKTNLVSIWTFGAAIYLAMSGIAIDEVTAEVFIREGSAEFAGALTAFSAGLAALRSSNAKIQAAVKAAVPIVVVGITAGIIVGCVGLARIDPETGLPVGQAIALEVGNIAGVFAPGTSAMVAGGVSSLLSILTLLGRAAESGT